MSTFEIRKDQLAVQVVADDEIDALSQAVDADVLHDGDEGNIEPVPDPDVEPYEPEGPG